MERSAMEIKKFLINGKEYALKVETKSKTTFTLSHENQTYQATIISFDSLQKLLFFEVNGQIYKAKILSSDQYALSLYLFTTNATLTVEHKQESAFIPSSLTTLSQANQPVIAKDSGPSLKSPLAGRVIKVLAHLGQKVTAHQPLIIIESMKMENEICAPYNAFIKTLSIAEGNLVQQNQVLLTFEEMKGETDATPKNEYEQTAIQNR